MLHYIIYSLIIIFALILGVLFTVYAFQEKLIFYPEKLHKDYQFNFHIPFEEHFIKINEKMAVNAIIFKSKGQKGLIYYQHGNSGNIQLWGKLASFYTERGWDVLMYDFRGFGKSDGEIKNAKMLYNDAEAVYQWILERYNKDEIIIWGRSLGTGIASGLATHIPTKFLMLETPFYSFFHVAKFHYPYLPTSLLLNYHFRIYRHLKRVEKNVYIVHGTADETVPYRASLRLKKENKNVTLFTIEDAGHIDFDAFEIYQNILDIVLGEKIK